MRRLATLLCSTLLLASGFAAAQEAAPAPAAAAPAAEAPAPLDRSTLDYSNKWRIGFDNRAKADGTLVFRMVMNDKDAEPVVVTVPISKGTGENNAADVVKKALRKAFPKDFKVEGDDGEDVLVKLNFMEGRSSLELLENNVEGLKVKVRKE
ncbi:MAG: hypothetical protein ACOVKN_07480 [Arenimonas sp.]